jgi:tetratricopeptide (TPR) repeat protein
MAEGPVDRKLALCNWADALREQEHCDEAAEKRREAIRVDPEYPEAYSGLDRVLADQGLFDQAIAEYRQADELWRKNQSKDRKLALYYWGDALRRQSDYKQAAEKYGESIKVDSEYADAYVQLGDVRADQKRFDEAIEQYREADDLGRKKQSKERKKALGSWAKALRAQKLYEQVADKCREAIGVDPDDPLPHIWFGDLLADQKLFDRAIEKYRKAGELRRKKESKDRKSALRAWAGALVAQKLYEQAAEKFREAISVDPDDPWTYDQFGDMYADQELFDKAIEQYRQADEKWQKKEPKDRKIALRDWARALHNQKHYEQAAEKFREAISVDENDPWTYEQFGDIYADQKRFDDAIEQYRQADEKWQKKEPKDRKIALRDWAYSLRQQKHYEQAVEKYREAIRVDENDPWTYYLR